MHDQRRAFVNRGPRWDNKSTATLLPQQGETCEGIAVNLTHEEVQKLDPFEGYPDWYNRVEVKMTSCVDGEYMSG